MIVPKKLKYKYSCQVLMSCYFEKIRVISTKYLILLMTIWGW